MNLAMIPNDFGTRNDVFLPSYEDTRSLTIFTHSRSVKHVLELLFLLIVTEGEKYFLISVNGPGVTSKNRKYFFCKGRRETLILSLL